MNTNTEYWHQLRAKHIGASEVADLYNKGFNSYYQLWHIKNGTMDPVDLSNNERVMAGTFLEPSIIAWANDKWGTEFKQPGAYYKHPRIKGMGCTPDGVWGNILAEIKNVDGMIFGKQWECDGENITNAPLKYMLQVQQQLSVTGMEECHLIVLVAGNSLKRMIIYRDDDIIKMMERDVARFWQSIECGDMPEPDYKFDGPALAQVRQSKPIDEQAEPEDMTSNNRLSHILDTYVYASEVLKHHDQDKKAAAAEIMHIAQQRKKITCGEYRITIVDKAASEGKLITQEMVGTYINAKKASSYPKVTKTKPKEKK